MNSSQSQNDSQRQGSAPSSAGVPNLTQQQIFRLAQQCRNDVEEAKRVGFGTPEGKVLLKRIADVNAILRPYAAIAAKAQQQQQQQQPQQQQQQQPQTPQHSTPQQQTPIQPQQTLMHPQQQSMGQVSSSVSTASQPQTATPQQSQGSTINTVNTPVSTTTIATSKNTTFPPNNTKPIPIIQAPSKPTTTTTVVAQPQATPALKTPAILRAPPFEEQTDRLVTKRKLKELAKTLTVNDEEAMMDGDVEELLIDLVEEFVGSVTDFSCRLAKHRKINPIDVKDVTLNLEKNWGIRVPGYSSDELSTVRKWKPTDVHAKRVQDVAMARSAEQHK